MTKPALISKLSFAPCTLGGTGGLNFSVEFIWLAIIIKYVRKRLATFPNGALNAFNVIVPLQRAKSSWALLSIILPMDVYVMYKNESFLHPANFSNVYIFICSFDRDQPFTFQLGVGQVIKGWDQGLTNMCVGEKRKLVIPPSLGYGDRGAGSVIPGGATLHFEVELINIGDSAPATNVFKEIDLDKNNMLSREEVKDFVRISFAFVLFSLLITSFIYLVHAMFYSRFSFVDVASTRC